MATSNFGVRPVRCLLINVESNESIQCLFNPTQLSEKIGVNWNRVSVPGLSHQLLQYQSTSNRQLGGVEFYLDRFYARAHADDADILEFRGFMRALTVPPEAVAGVPAMSPPRVLFLWPNVVTIEAVLTDVEFRYTQFAGDGSPRVYTAEVSFEEVLDVRVTSEERRAER
ncbi:MAG: peptidoglycan-binding protein [Polyangiales bacterium]